MFQKIGAKVDPSSRWPSAIRLIKAINEKPERLNGPTAVSLDKISDAERTIWEFLVIAYAASQRAGRDATPFTGEMITTALGGAELVTEEKNPKSRNTQCELYVAALLVLGGADVRLGEPDLRLLYWGNYIGVACKRMGSESDKKLEDRLLEAAEQIKRLWHRGIYRR